MSQFRENLRTDGWTDGQTLFHRTLPAMAGGPVHILYEQKNCLKHFEKGDFGVILSLMSVSSKIPEKYHVQLYFDKKRSVLDPKLLLNDQFRMYKIFLH